VIVYLFAHGKVAGASIVENIDVLAMIFF